MERIARLKEYLENSGDDSFAKHALALEYIKIGADADAENLFKELLKKDPGYVGSYYHLGKLLIKNKKIDEALEILKNGMKAARSIQDSHSYNELQSAYEEALEEQDDIS